MRSLFRWFRVDRIIPTMALLATTSRYKERPSTFFMKYQHPSPFKMFLIEMVKSFKINDRAAVSS